MTINKAQGQTLATRACVYARTTLYVAFSSVRTLDSIHVKMTHIFCSFRFQSSIHSEEASVFTKVGAIVMLLRNFNLKQGLYNGTCMVIQRMCSHVLEGPMLDTLYRCQNIFGSFRYQHSLRSEEARVSNRSEFLATRACIYAWTALCGFFTCVKFGWHTGKVEAQILTGTNVGHTVLVPKIYFAPSDISLPFILKRHQFSLKLAFAMTINNIWVLATYAWTALCGFFTCLNFGQNTYKVEPMKFNGEGLHGYINYGYVPTPPRTPPTPGSPPPPFRAIDPVYHEPGFGYTRIYNQYILGGSLPTHLTPAIHSPTFDSNTSTGRLVVAECCRVTLHRDVDWGTTGSVPSLI
ncbi:hypothetical protein LAZ67_16001487 [Cordylochernes scorpioides]|uniref:DNA helicase Pif1-like 2B domain-containing protein n=1 Tax=Cordylochernes scorpioides TaxID=51811 RepID=A0ABY6LBC3_9ARAC|nr:hypothetical protein LAZ67_16001487 [Cordylochernes scorpioides]